MPAAGLPDTEGARRILKTHRRERAEKGRAKRQAPPVTLDPLRAMVTATAPATLAGRRDRTLLVLGFAMMARRSELAALRIADLAFSDDGLTVTVRTSKTDQDAHGATVQIPHGVHPDTDPVRVTRAYLAALAEHDVTDGPLLRRINRWDQLQPGGLSGAAINERVRRLARLADLEGAANFTAHGLRVGGPTEAAKAGHPLSFIAEHGRWSKNGHDPDTPETRHGVPDPPGRHTGPLAGQQTDGPTAPAPCSATSRTATAGNATPSPDSAPATTRTTEPRRHPADGALFMSGAWRPSSATARAVRTG